MTLHVPFETEKDSKLVILMQWEQTAKDRKGEKSQFPVGQSGMTEFKFVLKFDAPYKDV